MGDGATYRVLAVAGTRPNFMKVGPLVRSFEAHPEVDLTLVHTGQHYDEEMSRVFFRDLGIPEPDVNLGIGSAAVPEQTARIMTSFASVLDERSPDLVMVVGDVTSTLACALTSAQMRVPVAHVEAGLRSFDRSMPEERNRVLTDHISDLLFTTEPSAETNLRREAIPDERIHFVGNVMIDSLESVRDRAQRQRPWEGWQLDEQNYILATLHRPSNVDDPTRLGSLMATLAAVSRRMPVLFPTHPRTRQRLSELSTVPTAERLLMVDPIGYVDFVGLMSAAALVVTDSGGIQEETTVLGVPCITVRPNTERPITIEVGTNRLVTPSESLSTALDEALDQRRPAAAVPDLWDGEAAARITRHVIDYLDSIGRSGSV